MGVVPYVEMINPGGGAATPSIFNTEKPVINFNYSDNDGDPVGAFQLQLFEGLTLRWDSGSQFINYENLFNPLTATDGYYVDNSSGNLAANDPTTNPYSASDYIAVKGGSQYKANYARMYAFYDANKVYISGVDANGAATPHYFTTPANAAYLRYTVLTSSKDTFRLEKWEEYDKVMGSGLLEIWESYDPLTTTSVKKFYHEIPAAAGMVFDKTYNIKIRVMDSPGSWSGYSSAKYFQLNRAPAAINLTTEDAPIVTDNLTPLLSWEYSDPDTNDSQGAYQIRIFDAQSLVYDSGEVQGSANSHRVPVSVLLSGKYYEWEIKVKDNHGLWGSWSYRLAFYTNTTPDVPVNPHPAGGSAAYPAKAENYLHPVLSWEFSDVNSQDIQEAFHVRLYNENGALLHDSGEITSPDHSYWMPLLLVYDRIYQWEVRVMDDHGDWSNWTNRNWIQPVVGKVSGEIATPDHENGRILIDWTDLPADNLEGYNIFRSETPGGPYKKINDYLITESQYYDDETAAHKIYYYVIEGYATGDHISHEKSGEATTQVKFSFWFIGLFKFDGPTSMSKKRSRRQSRRAVLGKKKAVIQDRGFDGEEISMEIYLTDDQGSTGASKYNTLMDELEQLQPLGVRDPFGRSWKVVPGAFEDDQLLTGKLEYRVKIDLAEVD